MAKNSTGRETPKPGIYRLFTPVAPESPLESGFSGADVFPAWRSLAPVQRLPCHGALAVAAIAVNRLVEGVGQLPLLRSVAPLRDGVTDEIVRLATRAYRREARVALTGIRIGGGSWTRVQVERIDQ